MQPLGLKIMHPNPEIQTNRVQNSYFKSCMPGPGSYGLALPNRESDLTLSTIAHEIFFI